ncbi:MAG: demethoxyubiquinone hydroxylase family protein [Gammaproteobacteria bacterium]|nr:MAG: demethoxyubiquinone hydroxylase family protein [Gammaproteobacteria bacterium]RKZ96239.1 MAG: demethoxyubiquinone hydroxylase family protein [Gammaproteobacteria bacterium]RKZ98333.1 MAG: demethoxyubiquinone hydroxylase family protein [Gammaproteobacteria bacterium]
MEADKAIKTVFGKPETTDRPTPGYELPEETLTTSEQALSNHLMRVNHAGEVSAQALYQGQALTAKLPEVRQAMEQAAIEENDHLLWCQQRVHHFGGHTSILNPIWYAGSFAIGAVAGKIGDKWSLGFVAETEKQVVQHLEEHLEQISLSDKKSRAILEQMKTDELHHGTVALEAGGAKLPQPVTLVMGLMSKVMTKTSYWL